MGKEFLEAIDEALAGVERSKEKLVAEKFELFVDVTFGHGRHPMHGAEDN